MLRDYKGASVGPTGLTPEGGRSSQVPPEAEDLAQGFGEGLAPLTSPCGSCRPPAGLVFRRHPARPSASGLSGSRPRPARPSRPPADHHPVGFRKHGCSGARASSLSKATTSGPPGAPGRPCWKSALPLEVSSLPSWCSASRPSPTFLQHMRPGPHPTLRRWSVDLENELDLCGRVSVFSSQKGG